jgi:Ca2+-transporting ATPase
MAVGLGYGEAGAGLMSSKPRRPDQPLLSRALMSWLVFVGLIGGTTTLWVVGVAGETESAAVAHTMGLVTFSLFALFYSFAAKDDRRTMFTSDTVLDRTFLRMTGLTVSP